MLDRSIFRENLPNGGRGFPCALKKGGGHTIALTTITFNASCNHISGFICAALADGYQVIHSIGFLSAVMASEVIAL